MVNADGPVISFQVEADDREGAIARGVHKRRVVNSARFAELVLKKSE